MTSKEALSKLDRNIYLELGERKDLLEYIHIIEKDLEILEILKKIVDIKVYNPTAYPSFIILSGGEVDIENAIKIKEWLENE